MFTNIGIFCFIDSFVAGGAAVKWRSDLWETCELDWADAISPTIMDDYDDFSFGLGDPMVKKMLLNLLLSHLSCSVFVGEYVKGNVPSLWWCLCMFVEAHASQSPSTTSLINLYFSFYLSLQKCMM